MLERASAGDSTYSAWGRHVVDHGLLDLDVVLLVDKPRDVVVQRGLRRDDQTLGIEVLEEIGCGRGNAHDTLVSVGSPCPIGLECPRIQ